MAGNADREYAVWQVCCAGTVIYEGDSEGQARKLYEHLSRNPGHHPVLYGGRIEWEVVDA